MKLVAPPSMMRAPSSSDTAASDEQPAYASEFAGKSALVTTSLCVPSGCDTNPTVPLMRWIHAPESAETAAGGVVKIVAHNANTEKSATGRVVPSMASHFHQF
jgi:hypothetical protein